MFSAGARPGATTRHLGDSMQGMRSGIGAAVTAAPANTTVNGVTPTVPFCRVQGTATPSSDSEIKFEVWLPDTAAAWSGRMKVNGTGGYAGATPYARLAQDIGDGF